MFAGKGVPTRLLLSIVLPVCLYAVGCQKQETPEEPETSVEAPAPDLAVPGEGQMPTGMEGQFPDKMLEAMQGMKSEGEDTMPAEAEDPLPVIVPPDIQSRWKTVTIEVANKKTGEKTDHQVELNHDFTIPETKIKISVSDFLPDFSMSANGITSLSGELRNPAVKAVIYDGDMKIFDGWLFEKMPQIHPLNHDVYAVTLKGQGPA